MPYSTIIGQVIDDNSLSKVKKYFPNARLAELTLTTKNILTLTKYNYVQYNHKWTLSANFENRSGEYFIGFLMTELSPNIEESYQLLLESLKSEQNIKLEPIPNRDTANSILFCSMTDHFHLPLALRKVHYLYDSSESGIVTLVGYNLYMNMGIIVKIPINKLDKRLIYNAQDRTIAIKLY